jgi:FkbM family methyltransferase
VHTPLQKLIRKGPILSAKIAAGRLLGVHPMYWHLSRVRGVVHVGAHIGEERDVYARYGLDVIWIEPNPTAFNQLCKNISTLPKQRAVNHLVTDRDGVKYSFNVRGTSSSILEFGRASEIWPGVTTQATIALNSVTLDTLLGDDDRYQAIVLDTEGSELLVLKGATRLLPKIRNVLTEAADFESYVGCAQVDDIVNFMSDFDFKLIQKFPWAESPQGGLMFNLLFRNLNFVHRHPIAVHSVPS